MKSIFIALAVSAFAATAAFAETLPNCNPAQQNWVNGSGDTCSVTDRNNTERERRMAVK